MQTVLRIPRSQLCLSHTQIPIFGDCDRHKIHHGAHRRGPAQVSVNQQPDVARERQNVFSDPDEIAILVPDEAGQAGYTYARPHGDQVLADVVQFAGHRAVAGNAEQPSLLRHVGEVLIEGDELPPFRRSQMGIGSVRIETEGHCSDLPRHTPRFLWADEPHGNIGFASA